MLTPAQARQLQRDREQARRNMELETEKQILAKLEEIRRDLAVHLSQCEAEWLLAREVRETLLGTPRQSGLRDDVRNNKRAVAGNIYRIRFLTWVGLGFLTLLGILAFPGSPLAQLVLRIFTRSPL